MYRNLEEDRKTDMAAADTKAGDCVCPCVKGVEKGQEKKPAGNQAAEQLAVHYDPDG